MDLLGKIVQGSGCAADGTVAAQNPLSKALDGVLQAQQRGGGSQRARGAMPAPPPGAVAMQMQRSNFAHAADAQMLRAFEQEAMQRARMEAAFHAGEARSAHGLQHQPAHAHHVAMEAAFGDAQRQHYGPMRPMHPPPPQQMHAAPHGHQAMHEAAWVEDFQALHLDDAWGTAGKSAPELAWEETKPSAWRPQHAHPHATPSMRSPEYELQQQEQQQTTTTTADGDARRAETVQASSDMARVMSQNPDPKFQNSEFLKFMNQVSSGEVQLDEEKNAVTGGVRADGALEGAWGDAVEGDVRVNRDLYESAWGTSADAAAASVLESAFAGAGQQAATRGMDGAWAETTAQAPAKSGLDGAWQDATAGEEKTMDAAWQDTDNLEALWEKAMADAQGADPFEDVWDDVQQSNEYVYKTDNPFTEQTENFQRGVEFFASGHLSDAILAFEAEVQQHPENSEAWRMLGECHAENDEDKSAIICLERAVEEDPYNLSALMALGVSHVNELNPQGALKTLKAWVQHNPKFHGLEIQLDEYSDGSLMDEVMQLMLQARAHDPRDSDVQVVLGVLYNVSKDYDAAVDSFRAATQVRPSEYALWNKLGATLANSSRSSEAIPAYHRALEMKPRYARGWLNLGISHANLGNYEEATKCYLQALNLNHRADHIWSYLRICFTCMERFDLVKLADTRDVSLFRDEFKLLDL